MMTFPQSGRVLRGRRPRRRGPRCWPPAARRREPRAESHRHRVPRIANGFRVVQNMSPTRSIVVGAPRPARRGAPAPPRELGFHADPGHLLIVYFGYTNCPDVCPTALGDLSAALALLKPPEKAKVQVAMATVDPERDTAEVLSRYVGHFFDGAHALRTDDERLQQAVQAASASGSKSRPNDTATRPSTTPRSTSPSTAGATSRSCG